MKLSLHSFSTQTLLASTLALTVCVGLAVAGHPTDDSHSRLIAVKKVEAPAPQASQIDYIKTTSIDLLKSPENYLNKSVEFEGTFNSFSSLGLNYKKAFKDPKDFISILILRPDVKHHKIPLAELKLMYPRKKSDAILKLESGDEIKIKGKVFSTALKDPWIQIDEVEILKKIHPKPEEKPEQECC